MKPAARTCLAALPILSLLVGCTANTRGHDFESGAAQPIWAPVQTPRILSQVTITNGVPATVDLDGAVPGSIGKVEVLGVDGADAIKATPKDGTIVEVSAAPTAQQDGVVNLRVTAKDGTQRTLAFPVSAKVQPTRKFTYKAPAGTTPKKVCVSGKFNGWSANATPLHDPDGDGTWEADVPLAAGTWGYKLVVDGDWMLDPANEDSVDEGGTKNSKVVMEGSAALAPLKVAVLPGGAGGAGAQGGFRVALEDGATLPAAKVRVFVDNIPVPLEQYSVDPATGVVKLAIPAASWGTQQFVSVVANDSTGRAGFCVAPFDMAAAPRSPKDETIYYVVLDRFRNGDARNDDPVHDPEVHPLNNYMGGDIAGVRQSIAEGYFNDLGVTTLWISPPYEQPDVAYKDSKPPFRKLTGYHGYWPTDMRKVEPRWGTVEEFRAMVAEAHAHNLAVIIDFVSNHFHVSNPMVKAHPDWFSKLELPDGTKNIRLYDAHPFTTWFDEFLPDIAYDQSPAATAYMTDTAVWWLQQTDADGFRHDAVKHVPNVFWEQCTSKLREQVAIPRHKRLYQVGETVSSRATINQFIGPKLLDGQFDFPLYWTMEEAFGWESADMTTAAKSLQDSVDQYPPDAIMSPFLGNHDVPRFMGKAEGDNPPGKKAEAEELSFTNPAHVDDVQSYEKLKLAFAFLLATPGAPMVYYGDEIGMTGSGRPDARRMFLTKAEWNGDNQKTYDTVKALLHARKESVALRRGAYRLLLADKEHLAFARIAPEETAVVVLQRKSGATGNIAVPLPAEWGAPKVFEPLALDGIAATEATLGSDGKIQVSSRPHSAGIWRLKW